MQFGPRVRSTLFAGAVALLGCFAGVAGASAAPRHGLSAFGELKYSAGFNNFAYVNPNAPKGGRLSLIGTAGVTTFDSFNAHILKGDAAQGLELTYDSLMVRANDEPDSVYGLVARDADVATDGSAVTFRLRPEAKFSDGSAITAADIVFSFDTLKTKGDPRFRLSMRDVAKAEAVDALTVRYTFSGALVRDLPIVVATLPILSKAYYATHDFTQTTLQPPIGSGPYRIGDFRQGTFVTYVRRADYWGKDLPVNRGRYNFDEVRYEYYRDRTAELESLKAGNYDLREEFTSRDWATAYDIPAVREGRLQRLVLPDANPSGAQGFFLNMRRAKFQDVRLRAAMDYAFDFQWTNRNLFFSLYTRTTSFFENSDMKATGNPTPAELALLEPFRSKLPADVFGPVYVSPMSDASGSDRRLLQIASKLLTDAGWIMKAGARVNAKGEPLKIEFLLQNDPTSERYVAPFVKNLRLLGVDAQMRKVDSAQYQRRTKSFEFDIVAQRYTMLLTPGPELKNYWGSEAANSDGSFNLAGISNPVIDALIEKVMAAKTRGELVTAARAIDRVLRAGHYWVPHWYKGSHQIVHWDKFSRPTVQPLYDWGVIDTWWYDTAKAERLKRN